LFLSVPLRNVQANQKGLKLNSAYQLLVFASDINVLGENMHTIKRKREAELVTSKKVFLEVNAEKTECTYLSFEQNAGYNRNINTGSRECLDLNIKNYNLSVVLSVFETWSLVSMDEHRRKVFENIYAQEGENNRRLQRIA